MRAALFGFLCNMCEKLRKCVASLQRPFRCIFTDQCTTQLRSHAKVTTYKLFALTKEPLGHSWLQCYFFVAKKKKQVSVPTSPEWTCSRFVVELILRSCVSECYSIFASPSSDLTLLSPPHLTEAMGDPPGKSCGCVEPNGASSPWLQRWCPTMTHCFPSLSFRHSTDTRARRQFPDDKRWGGGGGEKVKN